MLNILELNTANYDDHAAWESRLPLIVSAIADADADIIGLSEIRYDKNNFFNTICGAFWEQYGIDPPDCSTMDTGQQILTLLQTRSGYRDSVIVTDQAMVYSNGTWEGLSIISRLPINSHGFITLSKPAGCTDSNRRITQWAQIGLASGTTLYFYNTHFALSQPCLVTNVTETLKLIGDNVNNHCVLVGDMNATPDNAALQPLVTAGLVDAWAQEYPNDDGYTFPSWGATKRIDYCWASSSMSSALIGVSRVATACSTGVLYASDHVGVLASFDVS